LPSTQAKYLLVFISENIRGQLFDQDLVIFRPYHSVKEYCSLADAGGRSKALVCGDSLADIAGSNPAGGIDVSFECCGLSGRGLCFGLITRAEESYRLWCVLSVIVKHPH